MLLFFQISVENRFFTLSCSNCDRKMKFEFWSPHFKFLFQETGVPRSKKVKEEEMKRHGSEQNKTKKMKNIIKSVKSVFKRCVVDVSITGCVTAKIINAKNPFFFFSSFAFVSFKTHTQTFTN